MQRQKEQMKSMSAPQDHRTKLVEHLQPNTLEWRPSLLRSFQVWELTGSPAPLSTSVGALLRRQLPRLA